MAASLDSLTKELIAGICEQVIASSTRSDSPRDGIWQIALEREKCPAHYPLVRSGRVLRTTMAYSFYTKRVFQYVSGVCPSWEKPSKGCRTAGDLDEWLVRVGDHGRPFVRKLRLCLYPSELLTLFASPEAASLLDMPKERGAWTRVLAMLRTMHLSELHIVMMAGCCYQTCNAGVRTNVGPHASRAGSDGAMPLHFDADHRWVVKAVLESMQHLPPDTVSFFVRSKVIAPQRVEGINACSWNMIASSTTGYHLCDPLDFEKKPPLVTWAVPGERRPKHKIPLSFDIAKSDKVSSEEFIDQDVDEALVTLFRQPSKDT